MSEPDLHSIKRGWILRFLVLCGFRPIHPRQLLRELRDKNCPTDWHGLNDYLTYLEQKGFVTVVRTVMKGDEKIPEEKKILAVTVTAQGMDFHDNRPADDAGVIL